MMKKIIIICFILNCISFNNKYVFNIEVTNSNDGFVLFNILGINSDYIDILNYNTTIKNRIYLKDNNKFQYFFSNNDFINSLLRFSVFINNEEFVINISLLKKEQYVFFDKEIYLSHYFYTDDERIKVNNIQRFIKWNNAAEYIERDMCLIDINEIYDLSCSKNLNINAIYLVINENNLFQYLKYSNKHHGYLFKVNYLVNTKINIFLDDYYYDINTFQMTKTIVNNSKKTNKILIPKKYKDKFIDMTLYVLSNRKLVKFRTSVYYKQLKD